MASIKLKHSGGNGVIIAAPSSNPASDKTLTLPSDVDGTVVSKDSSNSLQNITGINGGQLGNRRININGGFEVFQRSTSATSVGSSEGYFAPDRYQQKGTGSMRYTASQSTDVPAGYGFSKSLKYDCTTASGTVSAGHYVAIEHRMEGQDCQVFCKGTAQAKEFTISFHVKSPKTGVHWVEFYDDDNDRHVCKSYTISSANTWQKISLTFPADTTGAFANDNGSSLRIFFWLMAGTTYTGGGTPPSTWAAFTANKRATGQVNVFDSTSNDFFITGIQLEVGSVATDFEHRSFGQELSLCQRYFQANTVGANEYEGHGGNISGSTSVTFPTKMRSQPSITYTSTVNSFLTNNQYSGDIFTDGSGFVYRVNITGSGTWKRTNTYTADSEL